MRSLFVAILAACALTLAGGCGKKDSAGGGGYPKPEGTYLIAGIETNGERLDELFEKAPEQERTVTFSGNTMTANKRGKDESIDVKYDTSKTPAHITTTEKKPGGTTETSYGIYKIEGGTLTICMTEADDAKEEDRPKEFKTVKGGKEFLMTLRKK